MGFRALEAKIQESRQKRIKRALIGAQFWGCPAGKEGGRGRVGNGGEGREWRRGSRMEERVGIQSRISGSEDLVREAWDD
uniref:Uncharacterized protein n=1 Tax=Physcomitrium patens TaxID=3218 RepID=A0A2K1J0J2_PHYPA|nr:hypothetical protein PHYPA_022942 [Physcomitrium patens]